MKKLVTLLLCVAMVLTCMAPAMAEGITVPELPIVDEVVTYEIMANIQGNDVDPKEVPFQKWLEEKTNVHFNWTVLTNAETSERISTVMASGDLPDVFINCLSSSNRLTYGQAGALLPVDEYLEYMPNYAWILDNEAGARATLTTPDGHIYSVPQVNMYSTWPGDGVYVSTTVNINQKWLDKLGLEAPKTTAEMTEVLKAFRDNDLNGNGVQDEVGLSFQYGQNNNGAWAFLFSPFGIQGWGEYKNVEDGKVFYAVTDPRYVEAIKWIRELWAEGLIDPEAFTQDGNRYTAKMAEGNTGIFTDWANGTYVNDPEDPTYVIMPPIAGPDGTIEYSNQPAGFNTNYCMIASTAENPEILCRYFDYMYTEEVSFQTLWGMFGDYAQNNGDGTYTRYTGKDYPQIFESAIRVMPAYFSNELVTRSYELNVDTGVTTDKTGNSKYIASAVYAPYAVKEFYPSITLGDEANERIAVLSTPIINAIEEKEIAWIMGEGKIEDEYESFIAELNALGLEEMTQIYQDAYTFALGGE